MACRRWPWLVSWSQIAGEILGKLMAQLSHSEMDAGFVISSDVETWNMWLWHAGQCIPHLLKPFWIVCCPETFVGDWSNWFAGGKKQWINSQLDRRSIDRVVSKFSLEFWGLNLASHLLQWSWHWSFPTKMNWMNHQIHKRSMNVNLLNQSADFHLYLPTFTFICHPSPKLSFTSKIKGQIWFFNNLSFIMDLTFWRQLYLKGRA